MARRPYWIWLLSLVAMMSCESEKTADPNRGWNSKAKEYYIQYQVKLVYGQRVMVSFIDEQGKFASVHTGNTGGKFIRTVGPVSKGFTAIVKADADFSADIELSIHCCKGSEPFVQKASGINHVLWTID